MRAHIYVSGLILSNILHNPIERFRIAQDRLYSLGWGIGLPWARSGQGEGVAAGIQVVGLVGVDATVPTRTRAQGTVQISMVRVMNHWAPWPKWVFLKRNPPAPRAWVSKW